MDAGFVYIIKSLSLDYYYIGATGNPLKRLAEHNSGTTASIRNKGPWILVFTQQYPSLTEAKRIELKLKKLKRRDYIEDIIKDGYIKMR